MRIVQCTNCKKKYTRELNNLHIISLPAASSELAKTIVDNGPGVGGLPLNQPGHQLGGDLQVGEEEEGQRV